MTNDWQIAKCLTLSATLALAAMGLIGLANLGIDIPGLRQIIGFIFLTFVPGMLILRTLRIHNIGIIESLVYSVGLSLTFIMFTMATINFVLPFAGISKPISLPQITAVLIALMLILMAAAYFRDKDFRLQRKVEPEKKIYLPAVLFLLLLLLLTVLAVFIIDAHQNNTLLIICLMAIAGVVGLAAFNKFIQPGIYPLAIFTISLCLLYQTTLMSPYLIGTDIHTEYQFYRLVANNGFWDATIPRTVNACLSITMLAPVYSLLLNLDGVRVFKAIYPVLFSLVPLVLYHIFSQQVGQRKAFLAAFFFMAVPTFMLEMIALCRQQIAELFLVLLILVLVDTKLSSGQKLALATIFSVSMIVSHYALGIIGFIYMGLFLLFALLLRSGLFKRAWGWLTGKAGGLPRSLLASQPTPTKILIAVVIIYFTVGVAWYGTVASGVNLDLAKSLWAKYTRVIAAELTKIPVQSAQPPPDESEPTRPPVFFEFNSRDVLVQTALGLDFARASPQGKGFRILQYLTQLFLIAGCLRLIFSPRGLKFTTEYIAVSLISLLLLGACIFLPGFANALNTTRMYHIALITLAPFCILGGEAIWLGAGSLWPKIRRRVQGFSLTSDVEGRAFLRFMALAILIPYFLFTSGIIYEITGQKNTERVDTPYSIALSSYRLDLAGVFYWRDGAAAHWLAEHTDDKLTVYADMHTVMFLNDHLSGGDVYLFPADAELPQDAYIYLSARNTASGKFTTVVYQRPKVPAAGLRRSSYFEEVPGLLKAIEARNRIYTNGGAQVLAGK